MTRDTPAQFFEDYTITAEGRLVHDGGEEVPFNGDLTFTDLSSVPGPTYVASFIDGRCIRILLEDQHKRLMEAGRRLIHSDSVFEQLMKDSLPNARMSKPFAQTKPEDAHHVDRTPREQAELDKKFEP